MSNGEAEQMCQEEIKKREPNAVAFTPIRIEMDPAGFEAECIVWVGDIPCAMVINRRGKDGCS